MLDRTAAPSFNVPDTFEIKKATTSVLKGGITLHSINAGDQPICKLEIIFKGGKWFEPANGISWFTNKMLLEGTENYSSEQINKTFEQLGAFYEIHPGQDESILTIYVLNKNLTKLFPVLREILSKPSFPEKDLETLKNIQIQTIKINLEKNNFVVTRQFREQLFGKDYPYGRNIAIENIKDINSKTLNDFFQEQLYNNFEVLICGNITEEVRTEIEQFFSEFVVPNDINTAKSHIQHSFGNYALDKNDSLQSSLRIGKKSISKSHPDYVKLLIVNEIFGGYFGSRLMQKLREEKGYTYGVYSQIVNHKYESFFIIAADVIKQHKEEAIEDIKHEWYDIYNNGVSKQELDKVKNYFKGSFLSSITNPFALADKFKNIHFHNLDYTFYESLFSKIDGVNESDVQHILKKYLDLEEMLFVTVG